MSKNKTSARRYRRKVDRQIAAERNDEAGVQPAREESANGKCGNQNARKHGMYAKATWAPKGGAAAGGGTALDDEIAATRAVLLSMLAEELPTTEKLKALNIATTTLTRLLRTKQKLEAAGTNEVRDGLQRALEELELGEG